MKKIAITSGDIDGIGLEVSIKALKKIGPKKNVRFFLFRNPGLGALDKVLSRFDVITVSSLNEALSIHSFESPVLFDVQQKSSPAVWVEEVAKACYSKHLSAMVTAPLSKQEIKRCGFNDLGHTDILKRVTDSKTAYMCFAGQHFSVILATGHIPISSVADSLSEGLFLNCLENANTFRLFIKSKAPIGLMGLNPHAGDGGLIGSEECSLFKSVLTKARKKKIPVEGPLIPDVAFGKQNWKKYSVYVACYHDQGLIPFKTMHGYGGVHLTLGLPIKRTSVDHGTAKDIFGQNKADPSSMIDAINWAIKN